MWYKQFQLRSNMMPILLNTLSNDITEPFLPYSILAAVKELTLQPRSPSLKDVQIISVGMQANDTNSTNYHDKTLNEWCEKPDNELVDAEHWQFHTTWKRMVDEVLIQDIDTLINSKNRLAYPT